MQPVNHCTTKKCLLGTAVGMSAVTALTLALIARKATFSNPAIPTWVNRSAVVIGFGSIALAAIWLAMGCCLRSRIVPTQPPPPERPELAPHLVPIGCGWGTENEFVTREDLLNTIEANDIGTPEAPTFADLDTPVNMTPWEEVPGHRLLILHRTQGDRIFARAFDIEELHADQIVHRHERCYDDNSTPLTADQLHTLELAMERSRRIVG